MGVVSHGKIGQSIGYVVSHIFGAVMVCCISHITGKKIDRAYSLGPSSQAQSRDAQKLGKKIDPVSIETGSWVARDCLVSSG